MIRRTIIILLMALAMLNSANSLGVAPSRTEIFYESLGESEIAIRIINSDRKDMEVNIIAKGDLAQYITIPEENVHVSADELEKRVVYRINFPVKMEPGEKSAEIWIVESSGKGKNIQANIGVVHKLLVYVPYPDEYVQGIFMIGDARPGEPVVFTIILTNAGEKDIVSAQGQILLRGPDGRGVASIETGTTSLKTKEKSKITATWNADVDPGTYHAQAMVKYAGRLLVLDKDFDVGEPLLEIEDARVGAFKLGTIARFDIMLESKWNQEMNNVYGDTEITDTNGAKISSFKTGNIDLPALGRKEISSYWDTKGISPGQFLLNVKANYFGRTNEKTYEINVMEDRIEVAGQLTGNVVSEEGSSSGSLIFMLIGGIGLLGVIITVMMKKKMGIKPSLKEVYAKPHALPKKSMPEGQLSGYIYNKLKEGYSPHIIREGLLAKGADRDAIDREMMKAEDELASQKK